MPTTAPRRISSSLLGEISVFNTSAAIKNSNPKTILCVKSDLISAYVRDFPCLHLDYIDYCPDASINDDYCTKKSEKESEELEKLFDWHWISHFTK